MAEAPGGERTEDPTPKRLADAVRDGDRLQSRELAVACVMLGGLGWVILSGDMLVDALHIMLASGLRFDAHDVDDANWGPRLWGLLSLLAVPFGGLILATFVAALAAPAALGSLSPSAKSLAFKSSRISPVAGLKRMFGTSGLIELGKSMLKTILIGAIGIVFLMQNLPTFAGLATQDGLAAPAALGSLFIQMLIWMLAGLVMIALVDVPVARMQRLARLKMSRQQVQDEHKEAEGSPERKSAQRNAAYAILSRSARKGIKDAQLVLVNPSHFAVALRYRPGADAAPVVVARGADAMAMAIRNLASGSAVPVLLYPQLTRAIYFTSREGHVIDERLFVAVATILAFIFRLDAMSGKHGAKTHGPQSSGHRNVPAQSRLPDIDVPAALQFDGDGNLA